MPEFIEVRGARVHNLKNINVDIPLGKVVGVCGVSGSGKTSLALGVLYSEGFRRFLNALSTYTRRRIAQPKKAQVDVVRYLPAAIILRQRPGMPNVRSTIGTMTETLNVLRLIFSRLGSHPCPNGHLVSTSIDRLKTGEACCDICGSKFWIPGAESFSFNSDGACHECGGLGYTRVINPKKIVPNENLSVDDGAISPWRSMGRGLTPLVLKKIGVRTNIPYKDLSEEEKYIILHGEYGTYHVIYDNGSGKPVPLNVKYENAYQAIMNSSKSDSELTAAKAEKYFDTLQCPSCHGTRINGIIAKSLLNGINISDACALTIKELIHFTEEVQKQTLPEIRLLSAELLNELRKKLDILVSLGISYLTLDRAGYTLSNGELQRIQLMKIIQNDTTGVLYVLDEPSIGLHPSNVEGLSKCIRQLSDNGNTVLFVDHNTAMLQKADYLIEMGPKSGTEGGEVITHGSPQELMNDPKSIIGKYLNRTCKIQKNTAEIFQYGTISLKIKEKFNIKDVIATFPLKKITAVVGVSGSGKSTLVLDCLKEAISARISKKDLPDYVSDLAINGVTLQDKITGVQFIDATPIGKNNRSTVATYTRIFDDIRRLFSSINNFGYNEGYFSYNNKEGRCPTCEGLGEISADIQYLPDFCIPCPDCETSRYNPEILKVKLRGKSIADILAMTVRESIEFFSGNPTIQHKLIHLEQIGLGYLTLGEGTPGLSGGEAQRMRLSIEISKVRNSNLFILDEPTIGLHPKDVEVLLKNLRQLQRKGATIVVIEHDIDVIQQSDYIIEMGEKGGPEGGRIIASGTPFDIQSDRNSIIRKNFVC
jgi:excinuclease ABC subunit A